MKAEFKYIMLMVKDVSATVKFYSKGLGLTVKNESPGWAELEANGTIIALHGAEENGQSGSSPILSFNVDEIYGAIALLESMGAKREGNLREPSFGKVIAMKTPDGTLISLLEPAK
jgi:predicted enzyme related to lactoylglutathione lyase